MKLSSLKTNIAHIEEAHWIGDLPEMGDLKLKVRGLQNTAYRHAEQRALAALPKHQKLRFVDPVAMDRVRGECLAKTVLVDWENVTDDDGTPILFSQETAQRFLTDPNFAKFQAAVVTAAGRVNEAAEAG